MIDTAEPGGSVNETSETMRSGPAGVAYSFERFSAFNISASISVHPRLRIAKRIPPLSNQAIRDEPVRFEQRLLRRFGRRQGGLSGRDRAPVQTRGREASSGSRRQRRADEV